MAYYGITPPKKTVTSDELNRIISSTVERLRSIEAQKLIVYDIQDESIRNTETRPFPFLETIDPLTYTELLTKSISIDVTLYNCVVSKSKEEFDLWCKKVNSIPHIKQVVLVGGQKSSLTNQGIRLGEAIQHAQAYAFEMGAVAIPERHMTKQNEPSRMKSKMDKGCSFFVTQCVYDMKCINNFLDALSSQFADKVPPITITLTPCGHEKTFNFLRWLGVSVDPKLQERILSSEDPVMESANLCFEIACELRKRYPSLTLNFNVESVSKRKHEIDAACQLFHRVANL